MDASVKIMEMKLSIHSGSVWKSPEEAFVPGFFHSAECMDCRSEYRPLIRGVADHAEKS